MADQVHMEVMKKRNFKKFETAKKKFIDDMETCTVEAQDNLFQYTI